MPSPADTARVRSEHRDIWSNERTRTITRQSGAISFDEHARTCQDEELHLLASRRKLLARNDWLALDQTRPLRIGFPTAGDKDRVGRRRKIKKFSETRTKAAQPRLMTPLFEERLGLNAYHMSGALSLNTAITLRSKSALVLLGLSVANL